MGQQQEIKEGSFIDATTSEKILLKNEEIERLQEQLALEKEKHEETRKQFSDLKEAYKIAEDRTENAIADREKF